MKLKRNLLLGLIFIAAFKNLYPMPEYRNSITDIQEIQGAKNYTLVLVCSELEPIAVYAPVTYQESLDPEQITIFLPNTTLAEGLEEVPGVLETMSSGTTIFLRGRLLKKIISNHKIYITIEVLS